MEWISVKDRLPKDSQWVIVTNCKKVIMAQYYEFSNSFYLKDKKLFVIHWMSLPKPPKEK